MKKSLSFLLALALCCVLTACGGGQNAGSNASQSPVESQKAEPSASSQPQETPDDSTPANTPESSEPAEESTVGNGILIAYFTYGENATLADGVDATTSASIQYRGDALTGNVGLVADMIANATGGELFSILTK